MAKQQSIWNGYTCREKPWHFTRFVWFSHSQTTEPRHEKICHMRTTASLQSDQHLCCSLFDSTTPILAKSKLSRLTSPCSWAGWFESSHELPKTVYRDKAQLCMGLALSVRAAVFSLSPHRPAYEPRWWASRILALAYMYLIIILSIIMVKQKTMPPP